MPVMRRMFVPTVVAYLALAADSARAEPIALHVGAEFRRISREDCAHKAIQALVKEDFIHAEIDKDGNAWGRSEKSIVKVLGLPYRDGVHAVVIAASHDNKAAERLRNAIRTFVLDGPHDPQAPKQHRAADASRKPCSLVLRYGLEQRNVIPTMRFFVPATTIVLEKQGLGTSQGGPLLMFGGNAQAALAVFAAPGPNEVNVQLGVATVSSDDKEADRLQNVVRTGVVRVLFE
jgi:hypothetical protein